MSENINFNYNNLTPFKWYIIENFPFLEDSIDGPTNYTLLCKLGDEINKNRDAINSIGVNAEELTNAFNSLKNYVDNYFDNLDVQEEINNKLDELVINGTLGNLIGSYIQPRIDAQNQEIQNFKDETNTTLTSFNNRLTSLTNQNPIPVDSTNQMTDTSKVYLNISDGYWYYYNSENWVQGGVYQSTIVGDGAITILNLDDKLQANFIKDYDLIENPTHYTNYYCGINNTTNKINISEHANYAYDKYNLINNEIYQVTGGTNRGSVIGIIVANESDDIIYSTRPEQTSSDPTMQSLFFKANQENLILYVSYEQAGTSNYNRLNFHQVYKLNSLYLQDNFNFDPDLLYTYENGFVNALSGLMNANTGSIIKAYNMQKGRSYTVMAQNVQYVCGLCITHYNFRDHIYKSSNDGIGNTPVSFTYTWTASEDGLILISLLNDNVNYDIKINQNIIEDNILANKTISCDGDSIMKGNENSNVSYFNLIATKLGMNILSNNSVGGSTIATGTQSGGIDRHWISSDVNNINTNSDYILINGGFNDYANKVELGEITETFTDSIDSTTFAGGMELLCRNLLSRFTNGQKILFVFNHNINNIWWTKNSSVNGHTFKEYYDIQIEILKKYSIPYIDLLHESQLNTTIESYKNNYTVNSDGVHPTTDGYNKFYIDKIISKMKSL